MFVGVVPWSIVAAVALAARRRTDRDSRRRGRHLATVRWRPAASHRARVVMAAGWPYRIVQGLGTRRYAHEIRRRALRVRSTS